MTGVESFGLFLQGLELPAEGLLTLAELPADTYRFERGSHTLAGRRPGQSWRLGDRVRVAVKKVDLDRRALEFRFVGDRGKSPPGLRAARYVKGSRPARKTEEKTPGRGKGKAKPNGKAKKLKGKAKGKRGR